MDENGSAARAAAIQDGRKVEIDSLLKIMGKAHRQTREFKKGKLRLVKRKLESSDFEHRMFGTMYMAMKFQLQADDETVLAKMPVFALNNNCFAPGQGMVPNNGNGEPVENEDDEEESQMEFPVEILSNIVKYLGVKELISVRTVSVDMHLLAHEHAKYTMARKRGIKKPMAGCGKGVACSCFQDLVGIDPSLVRPLPFTMVDVGTFKIKKLRSRIAGNCSHIFVVALLNQDPDGKENRGPNVKGNANPSGGDSSSSDMDDSSDEDDLHIHVSPVPAYHLLVYDRHTLKLTHTMGKFSSGLQVKVQVYGNTLLVLDKCVLSKKVVIFDVTMGIKHVWSFAAFEVGRDIVRAMKYTDDEDIYIDNGDLVKDKVFIYCNCSFDAMGVLYGLDTDSPKTPVCLKVFSLSYFEKRPIRSMASNNSFCLVMKDHGKASRYTLVWQKFDDLKIETSTLQSKGILGECRIDLTTSAICVTTGTTEDFIIKPGCAPFKIFHDHQRNPQSRRFLEGVYYSMDHGRLSSNNIKPDAIGVWHPVANGIDTDNLFSHYYVDKFGVISVTTDDMVSVYKYPSVMKKFDF